MLIISPRAGLGATCVPTVGYASLTYGYSHLATAWLFFCIVKMFAATPTGTANVI